MAKQLFYSLWINTEEHPYPKFALACLATFSNREGYMPPRIFVPPETSDEDISKIQQQVEDSVVHKHEYIPKKGVGYEVLGRQPRQMPTIMRSPLE